MQWTQNSYLIRPAAAEDAQAYYNALFNPIEPEVARLTGSAFHYPENVVIPFFLRCVADDTRHDFLILSPQGHIIGESVINEYNPEDNSANYRIAITGAEHRDHGIGTWAVESACEFAFETLRLDRLTLEVFDFNPRARRVYEKCGFLPCGREDDSTLMQLTRAAWKNRSFLQQKTQS